MLSVTTADISSNSLVEWICCGAVDNEKWKHWHCDRGVCLTTHVLVSHQPFVLYRQTKITFGQKLVNPPQQQSVWLPGGVDKPHSRSLNLPAVGWLLVFIFFPSVTQSDNIVLAYVCTHVAVNWKWDWPKEMKIFSVMKRQKMKIYGELFWKWVSFQLQFRLWRRELKLFWCMSIEERKKLEVTVWGVFVCVSGFCFPQ